MEMTTVTQLIGTVGFPIAMCLILLWLMIKLTDNHKKEMDKMIEALNNNTIALNRIETRLGVDKNG